MKDNNHEASFSGPITDTDGLYMDIKAYLDVIVPTLTQEKHLCVVNVLFNWDLMYFSYTVLKWEYILSLDHKQKLTLKLKKKKKSYNFLIFPLIFIGNVFGNAIEI